MKRMLFDMITSQLSVFKDSLCNYVAMAAVGAVAYIIAFRIVGELRLRGEKGSNAHWIIRTIVFIAIWFACYIVITLIKIIINYWIIVIICMIMTFALYIMKKYAEIHPNSVLNKKIL